MDLHTSSRQLNLSDLPEDILFDTFSCLKDPPTHLPDWMIPENGRLRTMQTLRLVCRRFCELASHLLLPELRVSISPESLRSFNQLIRNPQIAAGVRTLRVSLAYRPAGIANSYDRYKDLQVAMMRDVTAQCRYHTECVNETPQHLLKGDEAELSRVLEIYGFMAWAWMVFRPFPPGFQNGTQQYFGLREAQEKDKRYDACQDVLVQSHQEYRRKHDEQKELLRTGSFVTALAESISRLPSLSTLTLVDDPGKTPEGFTRIRENLPVLANSPDTLRELLTSSHRWNVIEEDSKDLPHCDIAAVELLWRIPIALHAAGAHIAHHLVKVLPIFSNFNNLSPGTTADPWLKDWSALTTALQTLGTSHISPGAPGVVRRQHISAQDQAYLNGYLSALLSSPNLEHVSVNLYGLNLNLGLPKDPRYTAEMNNPTGSVLATAVVPKARKVLLCYITFTEEELVTFLDGLGQRLEEVDLRTIGVSNGGGWMRALDVLREKVIGSSKLGRKPVVRMSGLCGGAFDMLPETSWDLDDLAAAGSDWGEEPLCDAAVEYVMGREELNPVAELEGGIKPG